MCDVSRKLVTWFDGELSEQEAAVASSVTDMQEHVQSCAKCRKQMEAIQQVNHLFERYCDAVVASEMIERAPGRKAQNSKLVREEISRPIWAVAFSRVAAVAACIAAVALLFAALHGRSAQRLNSRVLVSQAKALAATKVESSPTIDISSEAGGVSPAAPFASTTARHSPIHRPQAATAPRQTAELTAGPTIEIAIPAQSFFAPGAVPEELNLIVDMNLAPDGSTQAVNWQSQLAGFERRPTRP